MKQHTPGPWKADTRAPKIVIWGVDPNSKGCVALVNELRQDAKANAALIAAAPDLLAALQAAEGALQSFIDGKTSPNLNACNAIADMARAAIAKAEGN